MQVDIRVVKYIEQLGGEKQKKKISGFLLHVLVFLAKNILLAL